MTYQNNIDNNLPKFANDNLLKYVNHDISDYTANHPVKNTYDDYHIPPIDSSHKIGNTVISSSHDTFAFIPSDIWNQ